MRNTDLDWELFAKRDPYWAVLTADQFRRDNFDESAREAFFGSGEGTMARVLEILRRHFGCPERFDTALDFGCGVGRLLIPLARRSRIAVGVDVSPSMLAECRANALKFGLPNTTLHVGDDDLSDLQAVRGQVNFISSLLVFQHIPPARGLEILDKLLDLASNTCFGIVHFVIAGGSGPLADSSVHPEPVMEMNAYDMSRVLSLMESKGIRGVLCGTSNNDGNTDAMLYFHRSS